MNASSPVVDIRNLTKQYGDFTAVDNVSMTVDRGHILGFIGPNGAGKTTTIKVLVGLARPTSGQAFIAGEDCLKDARRIKQLVGYMPDTFGSYDNMRVREYLDFFGSAFRIPVKLRRQRIDEVLETTNATYMQDRYVESLSHGMKQRVGIARTLLHDPEVLILDEPANGLDPTARIEMRELLLRLAEMGKTLIVTSHILPELSRICNRVAIIDKGKLRASGTLDEIAKELGQKRLIEVQLVDKTQVDACADTMRPLLEESALIDIASTEGIVRVRTTKNDSELADVLHELIKTGTTVAQFRELQTDLEDAFIYATQQDQEDEVAAS